MTVGSVIATHAAGAGAALTRPIRDVQEAFPVAADRRVRVYFAGEAEVEKFTSRYSLNSELVAQVTVVVAFWAVGSLDEETARVLNAEMIAFAGELRTRLDGDSTLGGACADLTVGYAQQEFPTIANTRYVALAWEIVTEAIEYTRAV